MAKSLKKSSKKQAEEKKVNKIPAKHRSKGKTPKQVMDRHIRDEKDVITEEEFKNLDISIDIHKDSAHKPLEIKEDHDRPKDEEKDHNIITPWEIIK